MVWVLATKPTTAPAASRIVERRVQILSRDPSLQTVVRIRTVAVASVMVGVVT